MEFYGKPNADCHNFNDARKSDNNIFFPKYCGNFSGNTVNNNMIVEAYINNPAISFLFNFPSFTKYIKGTIPATKTVMNNNGIEGSVKNTVSGDIALRIQDSRAMNMNVPTVKSKNFQMLNFGSLILILFSNKTITIIDIN